MKKSLLKRNFGLSLSAFVRNVAQQSTYKSILAFALLLAFSYAQGQTNPTAFDLSTGSWTLSGWNSGVAAGSYPLNGNTGAQTTGSTIATSAATANMVFWKHGTGDPLIATAPSANYTGNYVSASGTIYGNGTNGIGFNNTGAAGIGSAVLSVNTTGRTNIQVAWTARTLATGQRTYGLRLMYRVGTSGSFVDANATVANIFYPAAATTGSSVMPTVTLPAAANNAAVVQVMWYYYNEATTTSGTRPALGIDDITVSSSPAVTATMDFVNVQFPNTTQNISETASLTFFTQGYEPGLTEAAGAGAGISAWIGYSTTNQNPNTGTWTWVPATFNVQSGNNDEFQATLSGLSPGTYYVASRWQISTGPYTYGDKNGIWSSTANNVTVNVSADTVDFANVQSPASGTISAGGTFNVYAQVYEPGVTEAAGQGAGISAWVGTSTTNQNPNTGTWNWVPATFNVQAGNNDEYVANIGTGLTAGTYYYASRFLKTGSSTYVYGDTAGIWSSTANNGVLTVTTPPSLAITGTTAHGTVCPTVSATPITYTITNTGTITATGVTVVSNDAQFVVSGLSSTTIAGNGGTATYQVTFTPASAGAKTATITVASATSGSNSPTSSLTGTGTTPVTAAVTSSAATAVATTTATLNGNVTTLGVCPASTLKGFVYALTATNATPTIGGTGVTGTTPAAASAGAFTAGLTGLATGSSYSFRAYVYNGTTYTYGSVLTFTTASPPTNDDCNNAVSLTLGAAAVTGNTAFGTQSLAGCTGNANDDVWYSFQTTVAGTYTITVVGSASFDAVVDVRSGACNGTNLFCVDSFGNGGTETALATGLAANTTYLVRVYDFNTAPATTTFTIGVTAPPATLSTNGTTTLTFADSNVLTPTTSQTFNLSGSALGGAPGNITVTAPNTNFQVSNDNTTWGASTTIAYATSTLASTPVYVRFVPQSSGAKSGNITFSGGGVVSPPTIAVSGNGVLPAPTANAATNITATSFDANWTAVPGATGYLLDVSTFSTFAAPAGPASVTESFETGLPTSYTTGNVTLGTGVWAITNVLKGTNGVNSGTASAQIQGSTGSGLVSPTFTNVTTLTFWVTSSTASGAMQVNYSTDGGSTWTPASNSPFTGLGTTKVQKTVTLNITGDVKLQFVRTGAVISLDDIVINYQATTPSFVTGYNALNVGNVTTYTVSGLTAGTTYYYRVRATDGTPSGYSGTITVLPASIGGTAVANQTICSGATPADLTLSGNTGNVLRWERASDAAFTSPVTIPDTTTTLSGAMIGALTATTYFRAVVQSGSNPIAYSTTVTVTVNPTSVGGTITGASSVCTGTNSTLLTLAGNTGTIQWQSSTDNNTFTDISGETGSTYTATNLTATTYYRAVVTSGVCASANSNTFTLTVNPASVGGTITGASSVCTGTNSTLLTLAGNTGTIQWQSSTDNNTFTDISGETGSTYTATNLTATTYYRAVVTSGVCASANSNTFTLTVNAPSVGGTVAGSTSVCSVSNSGSLTLSGYTGTITKWQSADDAGFTVGVLDIPNASDTLGYTDLAQTTYYRAVVTNGACSSANSSVATITVDSAANGGSINGDASVCYGINSGSITVSGYSGTITGWESSLDNFATTVTPINNTTATQPYSDLTVTTYYRAVLSGGACGLIFSPVATITVLTANTWTGTANTSWDDAGNWSCGTVPTAVTDVQIAAATNQPVVSSNISINSLTMETGTTLLVSSGFNMTVTDAVTTQGTAALTVESDANLLQINDVDNTGNITVERDSNPLMRLDYTLWSSPVDGQNLLDFSPLTVATRFYVYNPSTDVYNSVAPSTTDFAEGTGYLIRMPDNHPTTPTVWNGSFTGEPHNGDVNLAVTSGTYNAVGNPYPSTIDADAFITENNLNEALYFWRKTNNAATTSYATYTLAGGAGTGSNSGDPLGLIPNGVIQVGQGFIAKSTSTSLSFNNGMRVADNNGQFFRTSQVERNRIWLNLTNVEGIFSQTMVAYMTGATQGVDSKIDGLFFNDSQVALTSIIEGSEYAVQGRALPFANTDVVPLGFKALTTGNYTIALDHADGLFADVSQDIYLKDNSDNSTHDLREGNYTFASEAGVFNNRFEIVYQSTLGVTNPVLDANNVVVYKQGQDIVINSGKATMATVKVFDIRGRLLTEKENVNASEVKIFSGSTNQVLIVKIIAMDGKEVTKKVIN